jgi:uncharacterized protein DUF6404
MTDIDSRSRRLAALEILASTGMRKSSYAPPIHRLLWRFGVDVPPPHFAGFLRNLSVGGCVFATGTCLYLWLCGCSFVKGAGSAAGAGLLWGLFMASYCALGRRKHSLPNWTELPGADRSPQSQA